MSRHVDIETIKPRQYENSEVELGVLAYDYDEVNAMPFLDIVQCKECEHWQDWGNGETHCCCLDGGIGSLPDDFCSYGERKESE